MPNLVQVFGEIDFDISPEENAVAWRKNNERKGSVKTSLTSSHHKAWETNNFPILIDTFLHIFPLKISVLPTCWEHITDVEILKKLGITQINKIRLNQLQVAEYQMNNTMVDNKIMAYAEKAQVLQADQY